MDIPSPLLHIIGNIGAIGTIQWPESPTQVLPGTLMHAFSLKTSILVMCPFYKLKVWNGRIVLIALLQELSSSLLPQCRRPRPPTPL